MSNDARESEGYKKAKALAEKLKAETQQKSEEGKQIEAESKLEITKEREHMNEEKSLAKPTDLESLRGMSNVGLNDITAEDILPPTMFLVQGIKDKSELVDVNGVQCPDGKFFLKGTNEVLDSVKAYFVWVKKDLYQKEGNSWDGTRMYRTIAVRESDSMPFALVFNKSSMRSLSDLFTAVKSQGYPIFCFKTEIKPMLTQNKAGIQFWKIVVNVRGLETDPERLGKLKQMAMQFDSSDLPQEATADPIPEKVDALPWDEQGATPDEAEAILTGDIPI